MRISSPVRIKVVLSAPALVGCLYVEKRNVFRWNKKTKTFSFRFCLLNFWSRNTKLKNIIKFCGRSIIWYCLRYFLLFLFFLLSLLLLLLYIRNIYDSESNPNHKTIIIAESSTGNGTLRHDSMLISLIHLKFLDFGLRSGMWNDILTLNYLHSKLYVNENIILQWILIYFTETEIELFVMCLFIFQQHVTNKSCLTSCSMLYGSWLLNLNNNFWWHFNLKVSSFRNVCMRNGKLDLFFHALMEIFIIFEFSYGINFC